MRPTHFKRVPLDVTTVTDREEIARAFGIITAWETTVQTLKVREAKATDRRKKQALRLQLLNAENQLRLARAHRNPNWS